MRHVPVPVIDEPGEDEWIIAAAETVISPVLTEEEDNPCYSEEGMGVSML